jgi:hypothetical protein
MRKPKFRQALQMTCRPASEKGIIARSLMYHSQSRKTMNVLPAPQKRPMIVALSQR